MTDQFIHGPSADKPIRLRPLDELAGSLAQRVYLSLLEVILSLDIAPGAMLRKGQICEDLGVSRSPVSEAIARLAMEGVVDVVPQSGSRVSYLSLPEIREGTFIRQALELAAVERAAEVRTGAQLAELTRNLRFQALLLEDLDFPGLFQADEAFHALIMECTGFPRLAQLSATLSFQVKRARRLLMPTPGRAAATVREHGLIVDAIAAGKPEAARRAMQKHLGQLIRRIEPLEHARPELFGEVRADAVGQKASA
ncbi:MAG: GntR family transcriptional regulator [Rhodobacteraceae bacterium]|nr:GntR family transcriptional regulator [Paracoccaceae bacterium]